MGKLQPRELRFIGRPTLVSRQKKINPWEDRQLIDIKTIYELLKELIKGNLWDVDNISENTVHVIKIIENEKIPLFEVKIVEEDVQGSGVKTQYLILHNSPTGRTDKLFERFKHYHSFFKRRINDKETNLIKPYLQKCINEFKLSYEKIQGSITVRKLMSIVEKAVQESKIAGVQYKETFQSLKNGMFMVSVNNKLWYTGNVYHISMVYIGIRFSGSEDSFQFYVPVNSDDDIQASIVTSLKLKHNKFKESLLFSDFERSLVTKVQGICHENMSYKIDQQTPDSYLISFTQNSKATKPDQKLALDGSCIYDQAKIILLQYGWGRFRYFYALFDVKEFETEEFIQSGLSDYNKKISATVESTNDYGLTIREAHRKANREVSLTETEIKNAIEAALKERGTELKINADAKSEIEQSGANIQNPNEGNKQYLSKLSFSEGNIIVNIFKNSSDYLIEVIKPDSINKATTSILIVVPIFNGYDQTAIIEHQISDFVKPPLII